uniref:Uncharacterized protein n=1 Tax=Marseillevirus LCMAC102 TaxID=2506603 RepID=A0A481YVG3_9VIRU|nr:MAG: hypothetical protein LCMAC102_02810 [Marseillevirus LCMAC102]
MTTKLVFTEEEIYDTSHRMVAKIMEGIPYTYKYGDSLDSLFEQLPEDRKLIAILLLLKTLRGIDEKTAPENEKSREYKREYQRIHYEKHKNKIRTEKRNAYRKKNNVTGKTKGRPCIDPKDEL